MKKIVTLLLVLAMVFNMTIMASATEANTPITVEEARAHAHTVEALGTSEYGEITFETFADLKELVSRSYADWTYAYYAGNAAEFVISENMEIPEHLDLYFPKTTVKVSEGVTFATKGYTSMKNLVVNGTMELDNSSLYIANSLTVNGKLISSGFITLGIDATLVGLENITLTDEYCSIAVSSTVSTEAQVYEKLTTAANDKNQFEYNILIDSAVTLSSIFTIPANAVLIPEAPLTINGTCTMEGQISTYEHPITINGKLVNNGILSMDLTTLTFGQNASYSGTGSISVYGFYPEQAIFGIDLAEFNIDRWGETSNLTYIGDKIKLGSPTDLTWGVEHRWYWDYENDNIIYNPADDVAVPGVASFKPASLDQGRYAVRLYKEGETYPLVGYEWDVTYDGKRPEWVDEFFIFEINETGDYYFTVQAKGDGIEYTDGPVVRSETWHYVRPAKELAAPTQLTWDWPNANFKVANDKKDIFGTYVEFYFTKDLKEEPTWAGAVQYHSFTESVDAYTEMLQYCGSGYYSFKVMLMSKDLNTIAHSQWSAMSPTYYVEKVNVEDKLDNLIGSVTTPEEIREAIQEIDTESLKAAMLEDTTNTGVMANIAALEEAAGGPAAVEVSDVFSEAASEFDASKISIVGANLNNAESAAAPITLVVDKPEKEHVLDTLYNSSVAVSFSMDLENVKDTENLDVPVKVTLPVPKNINPDFLVILHYHADGSKEEVHPYTYKLNNQWYAEFVLTSFSDFVMTEIVEEEKQECTHSWNDATCTTPKTCKICGVTDGNALGHDWNAATCTAPKTCKVCGTTEGTANGHNWVDVSCTAPAHCTNCDAYEGIAAPHTYDQEKVDPKYLVSDGVYYKSCVCGATGTETFTVKEDKPEEKPEDKPEEKPEDKPEEKPEDKPVINFKDVSSDAFYYNPVMWAVAEGVTTGTGADTFSPDEACNRGQVVTFLWRAAGKPEPTKTENPFTDVKTTDFFYKAVLWAAENGITTGTSATTFSPNETCNRGQVVTFLSRALKGAPKKTDNPFTDVAAGAFYYNPVLWAVENGITNGTGADTFSPDEACNRGQVITFLYRAYSK